MKTRWIVAAGSATCATRAMATGSEMAGLKLVVPMLAGIAIVVLAVLFFAIRSRLPSGWSAARRSLVAAAAAPAGLAVLLAIYAAYSYAKFQMLR